MDGPEEGRKAVREEIMYGADWIKVYSDHGYFVRKDASGRDIRLEVDGGIKADNIARVAAAGADTFVAGSAIFSQPDYKRVIDAMRQELAR